MATFQAVTVTEKSPEVEETEELLGFLQTFYPEGEIENNELRFDGHSWFDNVEGELQNNLEELSRFFKEDEVLIVKSVGNEKLRNVSACKWEVYSDGTVNTTGL